MVPLLALAVIALPLLEVAVVSQLLVWAPWPLVLAVVVVGSLTGLVVLRDSGIDDLLRWRTNRRRRQIPEPGLVAAALRDLAGILLVVPGVVSTVIGLVLLVPPLRKFLGRSVVAAESARRERGVPPPDEKALLALPPGPRQEQAALAAGPDPLGWEESAVPMYGHIAGAGEAAYRDATEDSFFGADPSGAGHGLLGWESTATAYGPPVPPLAPQFPPATFVQPASAIKDRWVLATAQSDANASLDESAPPAPPLPPVPFQDAVPWDATSGPGATQPTAPEGTDDWNAFAGGRDWQDEPDRRTGRGRRKKRERT